MQVRRLGVDDALIAHATRAQQIEEQGLDVPGIKHTINEMLGVANELDKTVPFRIQQY